jgi:WD40 repeat protein
VRKSVWTLLAVGLSAVAALRGWCGGGAEAEVRSVVNSGHVGAVHDLEYDDRRNILLSAGDDGTVRIWDPDGSLARKLQVTQLTAESFAVNPAAPMVAVVVTDGTGSHFLTVWDWEKERQVFQAPLAEQPLFLRFSAMGTYLMYGESSWKSLHVLRVSDGSQVQFHPEGFGIVAFAELSRSEKTIMTYLVSGRLSYWDLASGQQSLDVPCTPYLSFLRISADRRWLVGSTGHDVVLMDTLTGAVKGRAAIESAVSLDISPTSDEVVCISGADRRILRFAITVDGLQQQKGLPRSPAAVSLVCWGTGGLFAAEPGGSLHWLTATGDDTQFGQDALAKLTGLDAARGLVALGSADWVRVFATDLLTGSQTPTFIRSVAARNPSRAPAGLSFLPGSRLLSWRNDGGPPGLAMLDVSSLSAPGSSPAAFQQLPSAFKGPLLDLEVAGDSILGIQSAGMIQLTDLVTGGPRFELRVPGASTAAAISATELVVGRNSAAAPGGSLLRVNMRTGETVSLSDRNAFTYGLLLGSGGNPVRPLLFSVGVDASGSTNLVLHEGASFERESLLQSVPEEDLDVSLALDPDTHILYSSLGRDRVVTWDGKQMKSIVLDNAAPRRLVARDALIFSLNRDSTVTVSNSASGASLAEIYLFSDGEWCTLFRDGRYAASPGGDIHVKVYEGGAPVKSTEDYRLRIEGE